MMLSTIPIKNDTDIDTQNNQSTLPILKTSINNPEILPPLKNNIIDDSQYGVKLNDYTNNFSFINTITNTNDVITIRDIMKTISPNNSYLPDIIGPKYTNAKYFVEKYIYNKKLLDYTESSFMGDIELLMKLICLTDHYIQNDLYNDVMKTSSPHIIASDVRMFAIDLYKYTLNIVKILIPMVQKPHIITKLQNYSVSIVYKLLLIINDQVEEVHDDNKELKNVIKSAFYTKQNIDQL